MNSELKKMGNLNREIREKRGTNNHAEEVFPQLRRSDLYVETPSPKSLSSAVGAVYSG
jgi:hypothetical protein